MVKTKDILKVSNTFFKKYILFFLRFFKLRMFHFKNTSTKNIKNDFFKNRFLNFRFLNFSNKMYAKNLYFLKNIVSKKQSAFSALELLFTIVILGIIASIALPKISFTRSNAIVTALQSDIATISSSIQEYALSNEMTAQSANAQWLVSYLNLSPSRWIVSGNAVHIANNGVLDANNDCVTISFNKTDTLEIRFNRNVNSSICQSLVKRYASDIVIPLNSTF